MMVSRRRERGMVEGEMVDRWKTAANGISDERRDRLSRRDPLAGSAFGGWCR